MRYKPRELMNGLTHCIAALLAVAGLVVLMLRAVDPPRPLHLLSFFVFGTALILLYLTSTAYHWAQCSVKGLQRLRRLDHIMIFVVIAATYTPICLIPLRGPWGWTLFGGIWALACAGVLMKMVWLQTPRWLSTTVYVAMGWLAVVAVYPLYRALQPAAFAWLVAGGLFYTAGALVYALKKPDLWPSAFGFHELFHVLVVMGSFSHFWVLYEYVVRID